MTFSRSPASSLFAGRRLTRIALAVSLTLASVAVGAKELHQSDVPSPVDTRYPGVLNINVNVSDTRQGIFEVHESFPVKAGKLTLLYPKWIPGDHSPTGPIAMLAGLKLSADGKPLMWTRDKYDVYAFHVDVPHGVTRLDAEFQYLSPRHGGFELTDKLMDLAWSKVALYPAGHYTRDITIQPSLTLPADWQFGTALETESTSGSTTTFKPVTFNNLVDSPVYAGRYFKRLDLTPKGDAPVHLDIVADSAKDLETTPEQEQEHRNLAEQAVKLFGSHHYDHYDFLFSLSDTLAGNGLEHHQSSEDGLGADYFTDWDNGAPERDLLAHEYVHSWNGKFRRPADLWTPDFNVPMGDSLLWVYEGQTQYWGFVLTARAGMWSSQNFMDAMAMVAANYDLNREGFQWRTLEDTTNDPTAARREPLPYRSWQMSEEYYSAGQMMWLMVDAKLRELTHDQKSLDDFAKAFFGVNNGSYVTRTYTFDDIVAALNGVARYNWAGFLHDHVQSLNPPLLDGLKASGWKLVYTDKPSDFEKQYGGKASARHMFNFTWSIGLTVNKKGEVNDVRWNGPAFKAGISTGAEVVGVNGQEYSADALEQAITDAKTSEAPIKLMTKYQGEFQNVEIDYHDGLKYPHLERIDGTPDYLSEIIAPKK